MNRNLIFMGIAVGLIVVWNYKNSRSTPQRISNQSRIRKTEMCRGKRKCAVIYVAPWCSACESLLPMFPALLTNAKNNSDYGLQIIVGAGREAGDNEDKAVQIGGDTIVDNNNTLADELGVRYYPTIIVIDESLKVESRDQAAFTWINQTFGMN